MHHHGSGHRPRSNGSWSIVTAHTYPLSDASFQTPQNNISSISSRPSPRTSVIISEQAAATPQPEILTSNLEDNHLLPSAHSGYTTDLCIGDGGSNRGLNPFSDQGDTYATGLAREANFNRLSVPFCQRPYGAPIFMLVIRGDISGVYHTILRGEASLWDHDPYHLGLLYVSLYSQLRYIY